MNNDFLIKLRGTLSNQTQYALYISPLIGQMPLPMQRYDDPFLPYAKALIQASRDVVCAYVFDFAAFLAIGGAGAVALERAIAYVGENIPTIIHGPFWGGEYAKLLDKTAFNADAATIKRAEDRVFYQSRGKIGFVAYSALPRATTLEDSVFLVPQKRFYIDGHTFALYHHQPLAGELGDDFAEIVRQRLREAHD